MYQKYAAVALKNRFNTRFLQIFSLSSVRSILVFGLFCAASLNGIVSYQLSSEWMRLNETITCVCKSDCVWCSGD